MSLSLSSSETSAPELPCTKLTVNEEHLIHQALTTLEQRLFKRGPYLESPQSVRDYLRLKMAGEKDEVFAVLFLDSRHRIIAFESLFQGTVNSATVHPRRVLQRVLAHNCAAVILVHNHPSGSTDPSNNDVILTHELKRLLEGIQVQVLDHFIVSEGQPYSFAESGHL